MADSPAAHGLEVVDRHRGGAVGAQDQVGARTPRCPRPGPPFRHGRRGSSQRGSEQPSGPGQGVHGSLHLFHADVPHVANADARPLVTPSARRQSGCRLPEPATGWLPGPCPRESEAPSGSATAPGFRPRARAVPAAPPPMRAPGPPLAGGDHSTASSPSSWIIRTASRTWRTRSTGVVPGVWGRAPAIVSSYRLEVQVRPWQAAGLGRRPRSGAPTTARASPGLDIRHFWEVVLRRPSHASKANGTPPSELMTSTRVSAPFRRATALPPRPGSAPRCWCRSGRSSPPGPGVGDQRCLYLGGVDTSGPIGGHAHDMQTVRSAKPDHISPNLPLQATPSPG